MEEKAETGKEEDHLCAVEDGANQKLVDASRRNERGASEGMVDPDGGADPLPWSSDPSFPDPSHPDSTGRGGAEQSRDRVLELVAMRLRRIGDVMDGDFRDDVTMTSRDRLRRRRHAIDRRLLDLFPVPPTSRKRLLAVRDFACETLTRDLVYVTDRRDVIVVAGRTMVGCVLLELVSLVACPVKFGSKGSEWTHWSIS